MDAIGSLSPELLKKVEKRHIKQGSEVYSGDTSRQGNSQRSSSKPLTIQNTKASPTPPSPYVTQESIHDLLHAEPVKTRLESLNKHKLEFMSYLRPILVDETKAGEGWEFLTTHVLENRKMFNNILEERRGRAKIAREVKQCQSYIQKFFGDKMKAEQRKAKEIRDQ